VSVFWVLLGVVVLGGVAIVASGRGEGLVDPQPDRADLTLPKDRPTAREDVDRLRFSVGLRGYRMDEVDDVLDRLALDIALRDGLIGELREQLAERSGYASPTPGAEPTPDREPPPVEGAAMVPPVEVQTDPATTRTLLVPLEQYEQRGTEPSGVEQSGDQQSGARQSGDQQWSAGQSGPGQSGRVGDESAGDGAHGQDPARG
jgi:DivIVA domain-containing protein